MEVESGSSRTCFDTITSGHWKLCRPDASSTSTDRGRMRATRPVTRSPSTETSGFRSGARTRRNLYALIYTDTSASCTYIYIYYMYTCIHTECLVLRGIRNCGDPSGFACKTNQTRPENERPLKKTQPWREAERNGNKKREGEREKGGKTKNGFKATIDISGLNLANDPQSPRVLCLQ